MIPFRILPIALLGTVLQASATVVVEDFSYTTGDLLNKGTTVDGWTGAWGGAGNATGRIDSISTSNLTSTVGGYAITQTGTGHSIGDFNDFRGINRTLSTALTGTIWFSVLINNKVATDHTGLLFNHSDASADYTAGSNYLVDLTGSTISATYGATVTSDTINSFSLNTTHLIVGSITLGAGNDTLSLWVNPTDLSTLIGSTPNVTTSGRDIGSSITKIGVFSYGNTVGSHGQLDALRVSDGNGNSSLAFFQATGVTPVPEASTTALILSGGVLFLGLRRRNQR